VHCAIRFLLLLMVVATPGRSTGAAQQLPRLADSLETEGLLRRMTLAEKAAQLVMPWVAGAYSASDDREFERVVRWVDSLQVGGVIISIGSPLDIAARLNHLQRQARLPLLVAADLEGGTAFRFNGGTAFPTNMGVGAAGSEALAYAMGQVIAEEGRAVGIHLTLSPVADVNNNPANPIINTRSFGGDPWQVARLVAAQVRGTQEHGMLATAKHFPGHGDTETDSHLGLPVVAADWRRLDSLELVPFRAAVAAGVEAVMSAHIALPAVDSGRTRPATMAPNILTGILRDSLGFGGLIITDALDMAGVVAAYGAGEAAIQALLAGSDLLLQPGDPALAVSAVVSAVREGRITEARLDRSVRRVLALKQRVGLFQGRTVDLDRVREVVGRRANLAIAREASARSVVLLKDTDLVDSLAGATRRVALVTFGEANAGSVGATLAAELRARGHDLALFRLHPTSGPASYDSARSLLAERPFALFAVSVQGRESKGNVVMPAPLAALIAEAGPRTALISFGSPYLIIQTPRVPSYLLAWVSNAFTERAVAAALAGAATTGRLPVDIPPAWHIGDGIQRPGRP
jgi:beta-N-acetylhexosaminidase